MNKYFIIIIVAVVVIITGLIWRGYFLSEERKPVISGEAREITIVSEKDHWNFVPETIEVNRGDKIILTVINKDDYDHGIAIDAYGVSQRMPANGTIKVEFTATQAGEFPFYCSVPCGEGEVESDGKKIKRGHFDMIGTLKVKDIIKTQ